MVPSRALLLLLLLPVAAGAEPPRACVPNSVAPGGCESAINRDRIFKLPERYPEAETLTLPTDTPLDPRRGALAELDGTVPIERRRFERPGLRSRGAELLPPVSGRPIGRDPQAAQRYQAPYRFD